MLPCYLLYGIGGHYLRTYQGKTIRIKGENSRFSIVCLYPNDRAPIPKRSVAYTQFQMHFRDMTCALITKLRG